MSEEKINILDDLNKITSERFHPLFKNNNVPTEDEIHKAVFDVVNDLSGILQADRNSLYIVALAGYHCYKCGRIDGIKELSSAIEEAIK